MPRWISQHRKLSAVIGTFTVIVSGLVAATNIWQGFSNEPLFPVLANAVSPYFPVWPKTLAIGFWVLVTVMAISALLYVVWSERGRSEMLAPPKTEQAIPNRQALTEAIAEFESQAFSNYHASKALTIGMYQLTPNRADYNETCSNLLKQIRIARLPENNPVARLYSLRAAIDFQLGILEGGEGIMFFENDSQFTNALRAAARVAREWV